MDGDVRQRQGNRGRRGAAGGAGDVVAMQRGCRHTIMADTELKVLEVQMGEDISVHDKQKFELED